MGQLQAHMLFGNMGPKLHHFQRQVHKCLIWVFLNTLAVIQRPSYKDCPGNLRRCVWKSQFWNHVTADNICIKLHQFQRIYRNDLFECFQLYLWCGIRIVSLASGNIHECISNMGVNLYHFQKQIQKILFCVFMIIPISYFNQTYLYKS